MANGGVSVAGIVLQNGMGGVFLAYDTVAQARNGTGDNAGVVVFPGSVAPPRLSGSEIQAIGASPTALDVQNDASVAVAHSMLQGQVDGGGTETCVGAYTLELAPLDAACQPL